MTDDLKLIERLRSLAPEESYHTRKAMLDAASAIERLTRELSKSDLHFDEMARSCLAEREGRLSAEADRDRLAALVAEMREVLEPFAAAGAKLPDDRVITEAHPEWQRCLRRFQLTVEGLKVGQFRRARALLQRTQEQVG